jgi:hypothetical protein
VPNAAVNPKGMGIKCAFEYGLNVQGRLQNSAPKLIDTLKVPPFNVIP